MTQPILDNLDTNHLQSAETSQVPDELRGVPDDGYRAQGKDTVPVSGERL